MCVVRTFSFKNSLMNGKFKNGKYLVFFFFFCFSTSNFINVSHFYFQFTSFLLRKYNVIVTKEFNVEACKRKVILCCVIICLREKWKSALPLLMYFEGHKNFYYRSRRSLQHLPSDINNRNNTKLFVIK